MLGNTEIVKVFQIARMWLNEWSVVRRSLPGLEPWLLGICKGYLVLMTTASSKPHSVPTSRLSKKKKKKETSLHSVESLCWKQCFLCLILRREHQAWAQRTSVWIGLHLSEPCGWIHPWHCWGTDTEDPVINIFLEWIWEDAGRI